ncbi:MAG TPA: SRPBCC family protein [Hyphomicrobiaceae bacterium]|nr:SRPBCC family protein [Hyphomicrobiaceae bacterium]
MIRALAVSLALSVAALAAQPVPADAHGPSRQKVTKSVEINAPADKVWKIVGNFQDMSWHPAVEKTEGTGGNEIGAKRTLTLKGGGQIHEALTKYDAAAHSYSYEITDVDVKVLPVKNYSSTLAVEGDASKSVLKWRGAFYRGYMNNDPPAELNDEAALKAVSAVYDGGLPAVKKAAEAGG